MSRHETHAQSARHRATISRKAQDIRPFLVMDVLERAQAIEHETGVNVIHLEVGEPDFDTPSAVVDAATTRCGTVTHTTRTAWDSWNCARPSQPGIVPLPCQHFPQHIIITPGSSPAILLVLAALLDPGDEVILSDSGYACYANFIHLCDGVTVDVTVDEAEGFQYTADKVRPTSPRVPRPSSSILPPIPPAPFCPRPRWRASPSWVRW